MLLGRNHERQEIDDVLAHARAGTSTILALVGEPGIGKTSLLDYAAERATGMQLLRARGIQTEAQIPFGSLLELLRPALSSLNGIPRPQALALEAALALRPARAQERFAVGAATLSLLALHAEAAPVLVLLDDAHWIDEPTAEALRFAFRRLVADPIAVLLAVRSEEPSLLDGADLPTLPISGLNAEEAGQLLRELPAEAVLRLHAASAGNPLALRELADDQGEVLLAPEGGPVMVSARIVHAFLRRVGRLEGETRRALVLAATNDTGDLAALERAAIALGIDLAALTAAESTHLIEIRTGSIEFRHPLARSAIYADAPAVERRAAHRALAGALPDRDVDRRAWHLAAAAMGADESASAALEQAARRAQSRSAYATAATAFERAARLTGNIELRASLLFRAAGASWNAGAGDRAVALLDEARSSTTDPARMIEIDQLAGHIAVRRGPVMGGHTILLAAAADCADADAAVAMLAEATSACFYAGKPVEMLSAAHQACARLPPQPSLRARFLATAAFGMAHVVGGDAAAGAAAMHQAIGLAEASSDLPDELELLPWLAVAPLFLREAATGRSLIEHALTGARERAALGILPIVLNLIARDQATTDRWDVAEATYREAIALARESDQRAALAFGLAGLASLHARRGREQECRAAVEETQRLCAVVGTRLHEVWAMAALGELELALGDAGHAVQHFEAQQQLLSELGITDPDLSPAAELAEAYLRSGREEEANTAAARLHGSAQAKGQPWSMARALRAQGLVAHDDDLAEPFELALRRHLETPDVFETARTRLAYGERLRRARSRVLAREQLRLALQAFEALDARPWITRTTTELEATGERLRRTADSRDELTPQELQIAMLLAGGKTTREAAAALFLSPKTIEYHLRHVYIKLAIHSRDELAQALAGKAPSPSVTGAVP